MQRHPFENDDRSAMQAGNDDLRVCADADRAKVVSITPHLQKSRRHKAALMNAIAETTERLDLYRPLFARHFAADRVEPISDEDCYTDVASHQGGHDRVGPISDEDLDDGDAL